MSRTRLQVVSTAADIPEPRPDTLILVLDPAWTPIADGRADLIPARRRFGDVVERIDAFEEALAAVDRWAEATAVADRLRVEGVTYWFRLREPMWRWVHERLLLRLVLGSLPLDGTPGEVIVPQAETAVLDAARASWPDAVIRLEAPVVATAVAAAHRPAPATSGVPTDRRATVLPLRRLVRSALDRWRPAVHRASTRPPASTAGAERARREVVLAERVADLVAEPRPRILVLTNPATHQRVAAAGGDRRDPLFGAVIPGLAEAGLAPVLLATGLDQRRDEDWRLIEADERLLPQFLLRTRWSRPEDDARADAAVTDLGAAIDVVRGSPLDVGGVDLGAAFADALLGTAAQIVRTDVHTLARVVRLVDELEPRAIVLAQEGIRTPWLVAGRTASIPVVAVQHGVLYAGHAGYPNRRHRDLCLPTRTFLYGEFERAVLLDLAYRDDELEVVGSPRLDLDASPGGEADRAAERRTVRAELGVADADRLLVVSSVNLRFLQRSHFAHMLETVLGGPLPGIHVVFKQHPGEHDEGPYRALLEGLAAEGGWAPPPISVIQDVDLLRLLRAADAHLGLLSTVLTDAVAVGTPNLIARTDRHADLLGYVEAGVARPVRSPADVRAALDDPRPAGPEARAAFLARHFREGDASARIVRSVVAMLGDPQAGGGRRRPVR